MQSDVISNSYLGPTLSSGAEYPASLYHLATDVFALVRLWRIAEPRGFFTDLVENQRRTQ